MQTRRGIKNRQSIVNEEAVGMIDGQAWCWAVAEFCGGEIWLIFGIPSPANDRHPCRVKKLVQDLGFLVLKTGPSLVLKTGPSFFNVSPFL